MAHLHRTANHIELHPRENGAVAHAWNDVVRERDLAQMLVMIQMVIHIGDQELALGVGELQACDSLGRFQHVERDPRSLLSFEAGPEHSGQQSGGETDTRKVSQEASTMLAFAGGGSLSEAHFESVISWRMEFTAASVRNAIIF